ncbi:hypothetical protein CKA32_006316 [Geitlerinema sp. FC II]|nr:hypothetical protein CKA32_006316 [Geitlerinema sp. FC II]
MYVGGVHWRCVTERSVSSSTPYFSSHTESEFQRFDSTQR